jgi:hypothetical protein|tara:strand:+ start:1320 stop:1556 length:237 start_codon:yes stop_codon:yes gene_type:complete
MQQPTNAVLAAKLDALRELTEIKFQETDKHHNRVSEHLEKLNVQVDKNSSFRIKAITLYSLAVFIIPIAVTIFINKFL